MQRVPRVYLCSRLTFAVAAKEMKEKVQLVAVDLRGHGLTTTDNDHDLSAQVKNSLHPLCLHPVFT